METARVPARWPSLAIVFALAAMSFTAILFTFPRAAATTYVGGPIIADTLWGFPDNEYILVENVIVRPGVTLTILPGTTVKFNGGLSLFVEGTLQANGFPGSEILFIRNNTVLLTPPFGIQFNTSSTGSVTWSFIVHMERGVTAIESSPTIRNNIIDHASAGVALSKSFANVTWNYINDTQYGVYALNGGAPYIASNYIINVSGGSAIGIFITGGAAANLWWNTVTGVRGRNAGNAAVAGAPGPNGNPAVGIVVDSAPTATIQSNTLDFLRGGNGGNGGSNPIGPGGRGGDGGAAAGIVVGAATAADVNGNRVTNVLSGRGGNGGDGSPGAGGDGGHGGSAAGIQLITVLTATTASTNWIDGITGNGGGNGGSGAPFDGAGGGGGEAYGALSLYAMGANAVGNTFQNILGGPGGNSTPLPGGNNRGGPGGEASGIAINGIAGNATLQFNTIMAVRGGNGGRGQPGGNGGNATGAFAFGDTNYNATIMIVNSVSSVIGGIGGLSFNLGGDGGTAVGLGVVYATALLVFNGASAIQGGDGGDAAGVGSSGGSGGNAIAQAYYVVPNAWSAVSWIDTVQRGVPGVPPPPRGAFATGWYLEGIGATTTRVTLENATILNVDDRDIWVNNFASGTTINTPFQTSKLRVEGAGELHVKNYLSTEVFWPDGFTPVPGANILVREDASTVWNLTTATGFDQWLLTLDRSYFGSSTATDVLNEVTVSYLAYAFASNPRVVDMASSNTQKFVMIDADAPTSAADALPAYFTTLTFDITYTASDGNGVGLNNITLWYRRDSGPWIEDATHPAGSFGSFTFTAPGDGTYEFETTATDQAGNNEAGPGAGESTTIVDTTNPASHVNPLSAYQTSLSFPVSWGPDPGVTDIATFTVQYNRGFGWTDWLVDTNLTNASYTATSDGLYQFRSIATDLAGNVETVSGNDTFTFIDTEPPFSVTLSLPVYQTTLAFPVTWRAESDDVASFQIDVSDDGGPWTPWLTNVTFLTDVYANGADGHTYQFRAIATDRAGNVENQPPTGNESWTIVDVTLPMSHVVTQPTYRTSTTFTVTWMPDPGVTDIAYYRIDVNDNGAGWTTWIANTTSTAGSFTTGQDGHRYEFRSVARDRAGNTEAAPLAADANTTVDTTKPVTIGAPSGTLGTNNWYTSSVTVTLSATDATSGIASISYRVDNGSWLGYGSPVPVLGEGSHQVDFRATDIAGNVENVRLVRFSIDLTPPVPGYTLLGTQGDNGWYTSQVAVSLTATDSRSGIASIEYRIDGGPWTTYTTAFPVTADGAHTLDYRATDRAGHVTTASPATFRIDDTIPLVVVSATGPRGANVNTTPRIVITFTEAMNHTSVESAFSLNPDVSGTFVWSADSTSVTYVLDQALDPGTGYTVTLAQSSKDAAGNPLPQSSTFQFTTSVTVPGSTLDVGGLWWVVVVVAGILASLFLLRGRLPMGAKTVPVPPPPPKDEDPTIDDVFLLYHDGIMIKHETRRLKPEVDTDILSGMLTAVQSFVKDSFRSEEGHLDKMTFGEMHILIGRGRWLILAAMMSGEGTDPMARQMQRCIEEMEAEHAQLIETWDGNMTLAKTLSPYVKKLIRSEYGPAPPPNV